MLYESVNKFRKDERGSVIAFVVVMFLFMFLAAGMAVDFIRHETARADLQNALDRGVLAASALSQSYVDETVDTTGMTSDERQDALEAAYQVLVEEYMQSRSFGENPTVNVEYYQDFTSKQITATANYDMNTYFLQLMGITEIPVPATSQAREAQNDIEVSLVLDVSGSMFNPNNDVTYTIESTGSDGLPVLDVRTESRITILKREAEAFVRYLLAQDNSDDKSRRSINLIPYSHQVAMPETMARHFSDIQSPDDLGPLGGPHPYGFCLHFEDTDYVNAAIDPTQPVMQYQAFSLGNQSHTQERQVLSCSNDENAIIPVSNDAERLATVIQNMGEEQWTSVYLGMKWGVAMLDPTMRPVINAMIGDATVPFADRVPAVFQDLPRNYGGTGLVKVVVLMSDGENTHMPRMFDAVYEGSIADPDYAPHWHSRRPSAAGFDQARSCSSTDTVSGSDFLWRVFRGQVLPKERYRLNQNSCPNTVGDFIRYDGVNTRDESNDTIGRGDARLLEACRAAKDLGVTVYTIAFQLDNEDGQRPLKECASQDRFYEATAENLSEVFTSIADNIETLRLTN